jgi:dethiobiotin synthetase/adenosylmethionine--8-amino-7-oxononanoate aminotransferase
LGRFSSSTFIRTYPDISVHAKLLTGGLVPLAATLASESIFEAFVGAETRDALLHGHSYTAHAVGCEVARRAVGMLVDMAGREGEGGWDGFRRDWRENVDGNRDAKEGIGSGKESELDVPEKGEVRDEHVWSVWSKDFVVRISLVKEVESVIALGSVLAIRRHAGDGSAGRTLFLPSTSSPLTFTSLPLKSFKI